MSEQRPNSSPEHPSDGVMLMPRPLLKGEDAESLHLVIPPREYSLLMGTALVERCDMAAIVNGAIQYAADTDTVLTDHTVPRTIPLGRRVETRVPLDLFWHLMKTADRDATMTDSIPNYSGLVVDALELYLITWLKMPDLKDRVNRARNDVVIPPNFDRPGLCGP